ncbi:hypothetical protein [Aestuariivirga sp.]|uniref:hypothetical protein n=1 Tax=Aestuariivirga sp. TaxID=2650926 RepID=UPI0039E5C205
MPDTGTPTGKCLQFDIEGCRSCNVVHIRMSQEGQGEYAFSLAGNQVDQLVADLTAERLKLGGVVRKWIVFPRPVILVKGGVRHVPGAIVICHAPEAMTGRGKTIHFRTKFLNEKPLMFRVAAPLIACRGLPVHYDDLIMHCYSEDREEPEFAQRILHVTVFKLRRVLPDIGVTIQTRWGWGLQAVALPMEARAAA